ncbi:AAA family ATPase [Aeromonas hydrophila]|uniref:AAA family ATPase n=1 Tax=Aeromonas hydrophila TaxID=644 RepID=UPI001A91E691|nr:AAA family ATPase [Aeromonas hydrophila]MBO0407066.1 AAA family ATPase [Aeromonas hydrophila]
MMITSSEKTKAPGVAGADGTAKQTSTSLAGAQKAINLPDLSEAKRLHEKGFQLCKLMPNQKRPAGESWNLHPAKQIDPQATGYGVLLAANNLCSVDPDNATLAAKMLEGLGFDLEAILAAGVRSASTRPNSGGRSAFRAAEGLSWIKFSFEGVGTVLELRAASLNLQDVIPGLVYADKTGELRTQHYVNGLRLDTAPELPSDLQAWWLRMSIDLDFRREQERLAGEILGIKAHQSISGVSSVDGKKTLAFAPKRITRVDFNQQYSVEAILLEHGYTQHGDRFAPSTATGLPSVRLIPGKESLWQSDHASDPLFGFFDAWSAFVVLEHDGDLGSADLAAEGMLGKVTMGAFDAAPNKTPVETPASQRFRVVPASEFAQGEPPSWIIKGVLPRAELVVLFGQSGSGKSFLALDMAAAIVRGIEWRGRRTKQGRVVYLAAEGSGGVRNRIRAYEQHNGISFEGLPLGIIADVPNLLLTADARDVAQAIGEADVVIIDTLAQTTAGADENAGADMGRALAHCKGIHQKTGAVVVLVHHAGKDATKGARGWSGLRAAADAEIEVIRQPEGRLMRLTKSKDGEDGLEWGFDLLSVPIGIDEDDDILTSCVIQEAALPSDTKPRAGVWERAILETISDRSLCYERIPVAEVVAEVVERMPKGEGRDRRREYAKRALNTLASGGDIILEGDYVWQ